MGQKVHPSGFRVGITKKHQSQWFARFNKHKYSQTVLEDRMIRDTLNKLFPELLNPMSKGDTKRDQNARIKKSRITQIKIERNIVPYQIDIQIHAENCKLLKSSIKNLQVKREIIVKLQKTRYYLTNLKTKLENLTNSPEEKQLQNSMDTELKKQDSLNTKGSKIKILKKKLAKLKTLSTKLSIKKVLPVYPVKTGKQYNVGNFVPSLKTKRLNKFSHVLKVNLLRAKLAKLLQNKPSRRIPIISNQQSPELADLQKITNKTLKNKKKGSFKRKIKVGLKLTKRQLKLQRILKKRLRLRKFIRFRDRLLISKGLFIQKSGTKLTKKILLTPTPKFLKDSSLNPKVYLLPVQKIEKILASKKGLNRRTKITSTETKASGLASVLLRFSSKNEQQKVLQTSIFSTRQKKKLVTIYVEQMKKKFLPHLNELFIQYTNMDRSSNNIFRLGYLKQWDFNRQAEYLKGQPIGKLNRFVQKLREKFIVKLNVLRKEFIAFGTFSCNSADIVGLFQLYNFLMKLNDFVNDLNRDFKHKIKTRLAISKMNGNLTQNLLLRENSTENMTRSNKLRVIESSNTLLPQKVFRKKLDNITNECRKIKFIEYLKDLVQKHRTENIFLYLASISESRQKLKEIKKEIRNNFDFYLPGMDSLKELLSNNKGLSIKNASQSQEDKINILQDNSVNAQITDQVNNILVKLAKKHPFDRTFSELKFEELERRKTMWVKNLQLIPKISIKFFSVNPKTLNQKASIVSESVVDALEKRKAFRKVIKTTKENLMRNPEIKGVKIQVAGRLNGAEIARTEWVRAGRVPLQTLRANLDYSYRTANTIYGIIGVKVWIFKGFTKLITK